MPRKKEPHTGYWVARKQHPVQAILQKMVHRQGRWYVQRLQTARPYSKGPWGIMPLFPSGSPPARCIPCLSGPLFTRQAFGSSKHTQMGFQPLQASLTSSESLAFEPQCVLRLHRFEPTIIDDEPKKGGPAKDRQFHLGVALFSCNLLHRCYILHRRSHRHSSLFSVQLRLPWEPVRARRCE